MPGILERLKISDGGQHYLAHADEQGAEVPECQTLVIKFRRNGIGPHDEIVLTPVSEHVD